MLHGANFSISNSQVPRKIAGIIPGTEAVKLTSKPIYFDRYSNNILMLLKAGESDAVVTLRRKAGSCAHSTQERGTSHARYSVDTARLCPIEKSWFNGIAVA
jgi:hypothetical protein